MRIVALEHDVIESLGVVLPDNPKAATFTLVAGDLGSVTVYAILTIEEAHDGQPPAIGVYKPRGIEWGDVKTEEGPCWPPVPVQTAPSVRSR